MSKKRPYPHEKWRKREIGLTVFGMLIYDKEGKKQQQSCYIVEKNAREFQMERNDPNTKMREKIYKELKVNFQNLEQQIKELESLNAEYAIKCDLYGQCLAEHLLSSGSDVIKKHLEETHAKIQENEEAIKQLKLERDAYRIEIEIYENNIKDK